MFILIKAQPSKISTQDMAISNAIPAFRLRPAMLFSHFSGLHHSVPLRCWLCVIPLLKGGKVVATKVNKITCRKKQLSHSLWGFRCKNNSMRIEATKRHICSGCRTIKIIYIYMNRQVWMKGTMDFCYMFLPEMQLQQPTRY